MELSSYTDTYGWTDGAYRDITLNRSCNEFQFNPSKKKKTKKKHVVPNACKKDDQIELKHLLQFPAQPSSFSGLNGKYDICIFTQEIQVFEG